VTRRGGENIQLSLVENIHLVVARAVAGVHPWVNVRIGMRRIRRHAGGRRQKPGEGGQGRPELHVEDPHKDVRLI
jgi:hypothetical protein